jgi:hypothetical protein
VAQRARALLSRRPTSRVAARVLREAEAGERAANAGAALEGAREAERAGELEAAAASYREALRPRRR